MKLDEQWVEASVLIFLVLGFFVSVLLCSPYFSYLSILLSGALAGRLYYIKHAKEPILPTVLMILAFLFGYLIASIWVNRLLVVFFFMIGLALSYYLHLKKILVIFKSRNFIK